MSNLLQRVKQYIDFKEITNQSFEKQVGYSNGAFATQLKNNRSIGSDKLEKILTVFPDLNPEWLLTGNGRMLRENNQNLQPVATNDQLSGVDVDNRKLLLDIQEKVDFIYTHALKEMAKKELEGLKNDIKKTKEGKK